MIKQTQIINSPKTPSTGTAGEEDTADLITLVNIDTKDLGATASTDTDPEPDPEPEII